jgi:hypothetical protein
MLQKLPISISDFYTLRTENYLYIDKTSYIHQMLTSGEKYYFLARPRRFGKSLLISTLQEALAGNKIIFSNLAIANTDYDWQLHGIIRFDLSMLGIKDEHSLKIGICTVLTEAIDKHELKITIDFSNPSVALSKVVRALHAKFGRVAILIDEYDSPILHAINHPKQATEIRDGLQFIFRTIKGLGSLINFIFITGVTSFSKAGLFSGLNNLNVITLDAKYNAICGYTDAEIDHYFKLYLVDWAQKNNSDPAVLREQLRNWYNGYCFSETMATIYNPFSVTNAVAKNKFQNFWVQSGTPTFLITELKKEFRVSEYQLLNPEKFALTDDALGAFDIGMVSLPALMFQTGYLTITNHDAERDVYNLGYPNHEVRIAAQNYLLAVFTNTDAADIKGIAAQLWESWNNRDIDRAMIILRTLFAKVPYPLHVKLESFYHSLFQMICNTASIKSQSEYNTSHGSIDLIMDLPKILYIVEIKFNQSAQIALEQIKAKRYYEPFMTIDRPIILLGLNFSKTTSNFELTYDYQDLDLKNLDLKKSK